MPIMENLSSEVLLLAFAGITLALQYHESVQAELSAKAAKPVKLPPRRRRSKRSIMCSRSAKT